MRASSAFFKLFPPPAFMLMPHAGLEVSDDAIRCLAYSGFGSNRRLDFYGSVDLPPGLVDGGDIKDEAEFIKRLTAFAKEHSLSYVKVSLPEEKAYLFQTDVPIADHKDIEQNIESKLEENVPLSGADAVFYFDILSATAGESLRASVSVVPSTYVEHYMSILQKAGLSPVAFEVVPKAIARAVVKSGSEDAKLIIHVMNKKTGIYVVSGSVMCFASTVGWGSGATDAKSQAESAAAITKEIGRVHSYWASHGTGRPIDEIILVGRNAAAFETACRKVESETPLSVHIADVWQNSFDVNKALPPISRADSLEYAVVAGLAFSNISDA